MTDLSKLDAYELVKELVHVSRLLAYAEGFESACVSRGGPGAHEARVRSSHLVVEQVAISLEIQRRINGATP